MGCSSAICLSQTQDNTPPIVRIRLAHETAFLFQAIDCTAIVRTRTETIPAEIPGAVLPINRIGAVSNSPDAASAFGSC